MISSFGDSALDKAVRERIICSTSECLGNVSDTLTHLDDTYDAIPSPGHELITPDPDVSLLLLNMLNYRILNPSLVLDSHLLTSWFPSFLLLHNTK